MRTAVVTHSSTFESRADAVCRVMEERGDAVIRLYSDFDHHRKKTLRRRKEGHVYLHMIPYRKNLSARRLFAIHSFAKKAMRYLEKEIKAGRGPELIYILLPANSFVPYAHRLAVRYGVRVIYDIIDLWPESLPIPKAELLPPVWIWKKLRDRRIGRAEHIFTECSLYQEILHSLPEEKTDTLYWYKQDKEGWQPEFLEDTRKDGPVRIVYMGAINNIIDIPLIRDVLAAVQKKRPVKLTIIGEGEKADEFVRTMQDAGIDTEYPGPIYEEEKKNALLRSADLGLNLMKGTVKVGLTMKSIDYLYCGLPMISNIPGDTKAFVEEAAIGVHVEDGQCERAAEQILRAVGDTDMRRRARMLYEKYFTEECFRQTLVRHL